MPPSVVFHWVFRHSRLYFRGCCKITVHVSDEIVCWKIWNISLIPLSKILHLQQYKSARNFNMRKSARLRGGTTMMVPHRKLTRGGLVLGSQNLPHMSIQHRERVSHHHNHHFLPLTNPKGCSKPLCYYCELVSTRFSANPKMPQCTMCQAQ